MFRVWQLSRHVLIPNEHCHLESTATFSFSYPNLMDVNNAPISHSIWMSQYMIFSYFKHEKAVIMCFFDPPIRTNFLCVLYG